MSAEVKEQTCLVCAGDGDVVPGVPCKSCRGDVIIGWDQISAYYGVATARHRYNQAVTEMLNAQQDLQKAQQWVAELANKEKRTKHAQAQKKKRDGEEGCD